MVVSVEEVSSSLVREYLSRRGLKRTIACMDEEHPRTDSSINNRSDLRQILHMEGLYRKNKVQKSPLRTLLEIIVKHHIERHTDDKTILNDVIDPIQITPTMNLSKKTPADTPIVNDTRTEGSTKGFVFSKAVKSRSFTEEASPPCGTPGADMYITHSKTGLCRDDLPSDGQKPQENESFIKREAEKKTNITESAQKNKTNRIRRGMMAGPIASSPQESNRKRQTRRVGVSPPLLVNEEDNRYSKDEPSVTSLHRRGVERSGLTEPHSAESLQQREKPWSALDRGESIDAFEKVGKDILKTRKSKSLTNQNVDDLHISEMILDDIDDNEVPQFAHKLLKLSERRIPHRGHKIYPMDQHTAVTLKEVLLGSSTSCFNIEWRNQSFTFSETHDLRYGLVQKKGGPCGVLASIQAYVLKKLLFDGTDGSNTSLRLRASSAARSRCLTLAVAEVLWRAGEEKQATVAVTSGSNHFIPTGHYKSEGILEKIILLTVDNLRDLQHLLGQYIQQFESGALGCILMTISALMSRSIEKVREDMDVPTTTLIGAHGYCTQELVNLLLCGRAVSNVFDDDVELDSGNGNLTLLRGIKGRCDIGLLSLFEHYNICKVGVNLQTPLFPIWVVCSESHFSVLFGLQRELLTNEPKAQEFDLYYYDGLANQQEDIRLTVSVGTSALASPDLDPDLIPPLEHCIRTKWKDAVVNWNDTEPIL